MTTPVSPQRLAWLTDEVGAWQSSGLVDDDTATRILGSYAASRRFSLARLLLGVGGTFVGVGLIWLVAANLDELAPIARFVVVAVLWLALLAGGELLAGRGPALLAGAVRLVAALTSGAVIFQAAQSLQVPAYEPRLIGLWGVAALVHAYATRARGPLLVGMSALSGWVLWQGLFDDATFLRVVLILLATGVFSLAVAALHDRWVPAFAGPWRLVGMAFTLIGLFVSALPDTGDSDLGPSIFLIVLGVVAVVVTAAALRVGTVVARWEVAGAAAALAVGVLLALWEPGSDPDHLGAGDLLHAALCVVAYVALAVGVAALGALRDNWVLTAMAAVALVVFTSFQSFAVFAAIIDGAWLFLLVGLVFLATGFVFDRARRTLASELAAELAGPTGAQS
ncbi:DUF2157 domain-containing protein [Nocardioides sp. InS609-2]|uniref:DUF2157 domain-containing protein n=1 Tax=Nocardioides sp. InS609-2 TaxID=2760705 RepID=UPI0020BF9749|nr:DUF2157 domain-containing protein [Nocardioides sp. InS609-2]